MKAKRFDEQRRGSLSSSHSVSNLSLPLSERRYEKLYNDAAVFKDNKIKALDVIYKKNGYTFSPKVNDNIKISSNFYERNDNFINAKKEILQENENKIKEKEIQKPKFNKNQANVIIERLYTKGIEKIREKNNLNYMRDERKIKFRTYDKQPKNDIFAALENVQNAVPIEDSKDDNAIDKNNIPGTETLKREPSKEPIFEKKESLKISFQRKESKDDYSSGHRSIQKRSSTNKSKITII
jgi:hypothetical protein